MLFKIKNKKLHIGGVKLGEKYVVGVDLGGTKILTALADEAGNIIARVRKSTESNKGYRVVINQIKESITEVIEQGEVDLARVMGVGLGIPGPVETEKGIIKQTANLPLDNVNIKEELQDLRFPIFLENDANAAGLGEKCFGAGKGAKDLIYVTISTGIGAAIIVNDKIFHGASTGAGEVGHMTIVPDSKLECGCGNYGCWEVLASGTALNRMGREAVRAGKETLILELVEGNIELIDGAIIAKAYKQGDQVAIDIINQVAMYLGIGFANLINIFNPDTIVVGGGVSQSLDLLEEEMISVIKKRALTSLVEKVKIVPADLGSDAGVVGAIATALIELNLLI